MFIHPFHVLDSRNASLSEGRALAVVDGDVYETPHQTRDNTDFPPLMRQGEARLCLAGPPSRGAVARRTRGVLVEGATLYRSETDLARIIA